MSYQYKIDRENNCIFVRHFGEMNVDEVREQLEESSRDSNFKQHMNLLRDLSNATLHKDYNFLRFHKVRLDVMRPLDQVLGIDRRVAWVLGNAKDYAVIHQLSASTKLNRQVAARKPFRDLKKALAWLGLPSDHSIAYPDPASA